MILRSRWKRATRLLKASPRGVIIYATGLEDKTISRQFAPNESGTLLEYVLDSAWTVADELIVVFQTEPKLSTIEAISSYGVKVVTVSDEKNSLPAISDAFRMSRSEHCLLVTEHNPFLKPSVALALFENAIGHDLAIPKWGNGRIEPLLAVYRRNAFVRVADSTRNLSSGHLTSDMGSVVAGLFAVKYVSIETELKDIDPELDSFFEVTDERSLQKARTKASVKAKKIAT